VPPDRKTVAVSRRANLAREDAVAALRVLVAAREAELVALGLGEDAQELRALRAIIATGLGPIGLREEEEHDVWATVARRLELRQRPRASLAQTAAIREADARLHAAADAPHALGVVELSATDRAVAFARTVASAARWALEVAKRDEKSADPSVQARRQAVQHPQTETIFRARLQARLPGFSVDDRTAVACIEAWLLRSRAWERIADLGFGPTAEDIRKAATAAGVSPQRTRRDAGIGPRRTKRK
jgi:hypothetical protein